MTSTAIQNTGKTAQESRSETGLEMPVTIVRELITKEYSIIRK